MNEPNVTPKSVAPPELDAAQTALLALYTENGEVARAFWEWRHKVISLYLLSVAAVFIFAAWLFEHPEARYFLPVPFGAGAFVMLLLALMDRENTRILVSCYRVGHDIEHRVASGAAAIYSSILIGFEKRLTYGRLLGIVYCLSAAIFSSLAIFLIWRPLK